MANVTLQVLDGLERGEIYADLQPPITLGREDENDVRLNDERVSRYHAKIQEDDGHVILTDLESTNGTRVNGHPVQMHVLRIGDLILIGRCLLVFGSPQQLEERIEQLRAGEGTGSDEGTIAPHAVPPGTADPFADLPGDLFPDGAPPTPSGLTPLQRAQVSDLLAFVHSNLTNVMHLMEATEFPDAPQGMTMPLDAWHRMQQVQMQLAATLNRMNDP